MRQAMSMYELYLLFSIETMCICLKDTFAKPLASSSEVTE